MVVLIQIGEGGKAVGGDSLGLAAAVHFGIDGQRAASHRDDLALESDNITCKNRELEVDAMEHEQDGILRVNILRHSEIGTLQEPLRATAREEGLVVVEVGEFDESLGISSFHIQLFSCSVAYGLWLLAIVYFNFQSIVSEHHAFGQLAVEVGGKAHAMAAMREPSLLRPHSPRNLNCLVQGEMGVVFLLL